MSFCKPQLRKRRAKRAPPASHRPETMTSSAGVSTGGQHGRSTGTSSLGEGNSRRGRRCFNVSCPCTCTNWAQSLSFYKTQLTSSRILQGLNALNDWRKEDDRSETHMHTLMPSESRRGCGLRGRWVSLSGSIYKACPKARAPDSWVLGF